MTRTTINPGPWKNLRDEFAIEAMKILLADPAFASGHDHNGRAMICSASAYTVADQMMHFRTRIDRPDPPKLAMGEEA